MKPIEKSWRFGQAADRTRQRVRARDSIAIVSAEYIAPCLAEIMDRFRFRKPAQRVIKRDFHGIVGAKSVGTSGYHTKFVVEALDGTIGYLSFGTKPVQQHLVMGT